MGNNETEIITTDSFDTVEEGASFAELFADEQLTVADVGSVVPGTIIGLTDDFAVVDIGDKSESEIPLSEFKSDGEELEVKVGDVFDVFVEKREAEGGLCLSREKAIGIKVWEDIARIQEEDGTIQGLLEILGLPYVGCGVTASALCMDKALTKHLLTRANLPTAPWIELDAARWARERIVAEREILELGLPVFVKPARLGSSIGISRVARAEDLAVAIDRGLSHDRRLVVESLLRRVALASGPWPQTPLFARASTSGD